MYTVGGVVPTHYKSLVELLLSRSYEKANHVACTFLQPGLSLEESLTYQDLDNRARSIAAAMQSQGVKKGDRVLLVFVPGLALIEAYFACLYAGAIAVPVYPPTNKKLLDKTQRIIKNATPTLSLMTQSHQDKFEQDTAALKQHPLFNGSCILTDKLIARDHDAWQPVSIESDDIAFLQYTSGSTSYPKGVLISHGNLLDNLVKIYQYFGMNERSIGFGWLPPYHDMGLIGNILTPIYGGYQAVLMTPFSFLQHPLSWLKNIDKYKVTISGSPNFAYDYCVKRIQEEKKQGLDLSTWELAFNGAEPMHHETMERFYQAFKDYGFKKEAFLPCYGLAEATLMVTCGIPKKGYHTLTVSKAHFQDHRVHFVASSCPNHQVLVSSGRLVQSVKIVDTETLRQCDKDVVGEIWVNSPSVAKGYWQQQDETEEAFHARIVDDPSATLYLRTGDLGFIHDDELYVTGRIKDLIILYGKNHYPQDIEYTLHHSPLLQAKLGTCAAFVTAVDGEYRLTVMCETKRRQLEKEEQELLFSAIFELIYQAHQLETNRIILIPPKSIPKTTSGKIRRNFCRQQARTDKIPQVGLWQLTEDQS